MAQTGGVKKIVLDNGFTVILNEDHSVSDVFGIVSVRAGSASDPADATGLAHYMEHVMFKGTTELGTTDWDAEKPHYDKIVSLYDQLRTESDEDKKDELRKQINEESIAASAYAIPNEFSNILQKMGGTGLNAGTGYDATSYFNSFPSFQIERWLDLYAHRFDNPVFRGFQTELETVYEEKNMYSDNTMSVFTESFFSKLYEGHKYAIPIIGTVEDLKNPSISSVHKFYDDWYVPENMALILSGNFVTDEVVPMIKDKFGAWEAKTVATVAKTAPKQIKGKNVEKVKMTPYTMGLWGFQAVPVGHADELPLTIALSVLSNQNNTGLFDKLVLDGDVSAAMAMGDFRKEAGAIILQAIPIFSYAEMRQLPLGSTEKLLLKEIEKLKEGDFEEWLLKSIQDLFKLRFCLS